MSTPVTCVRWRKRCVIPDRDALLTELERAQQAGDFAAQAETLMALAELACQDNAYELAQGLYMQAWTMFMNVGNPQLMASAIRKMIDLAVSTWREIQRSRDVARTRSEFFQVLEVVLSLCLVQGDKSLQAEVYIEMGNLSDDEPQVRFFQKAFECYKDLDNIQGQAHVFMRLARTSTAFSDSKTRFLLGKALAKYRECGDQRGEGQACQALGEAAFYDNDYEVARLYFDAAATIFIVLDEHDALARTLKSVSTLILNTDGYGAYCDYHRHVIQLMLMPRPVSAPLIVAIWHQLIRAASKAGDFATARNMYQKMIMYEVKIGQPEQQAIIYWAWAKMEYKAGRYKMGLAIYQYSLALMQQYNYLHIDRYQQEMQDLQKPAQ